MQNAPPVGLEAAVRRAPNKYLVNIPTNGKHCTGKPCTSLSTSVFDELDLKYIALSTSVFNELDLKKERVDLKPHTEGTDTHWYVTTMPKGSCLYQGAVYDFDKNKSLPEMAAD
jgi:hypothetical protein